MAKKQAKAKNIIINSNKISEKTDDQATPQDILNNELLEHLKFNKKYTDTVSKLVSRQSQKIREYNSKTSNYKSVSLLKKLMIKIREVYDKNFKKNAAMENELLVLEKQIKSTQSEILKNTFDRSEIIKFLKIPYKAQYHAKDIDMLLKVIENKDSTKDEIRRTLKLYKKRLTASIKHSYEAKKLSDPKFNYFKINKDYDPTTILENKDMTSIVKDNEEMVYALFKLLKTNLEIVKLIDENIIVEKPSKTFINFAADLKAKLDKAYSNIGKEDLKNFIDEVAEEKKIQEAKKEIKKSKKSLEDAIEDDISKGNEEIEKALMDATPKKHKR